MMQLYRLIYYS